MAPTAKATADPQYFFRDRYGPTLMRRVGGVDEVWVTDHWQPTQAIAAYMAGSDDWIDPLSADEAKRRFPEAVPS